MCQSSIGCQNNSEVHTQACNHYTNQLSKVKTIYNTSGQPWLPELIFTQQQK
ncbi:hypothetical protein LguiA_022289 [Lonicera macranthoides]